MFVARQFHIHVGTQLFALVSASSVKIGNHGEVQERLNWTVSKTVVRVMRTEGSNPSLSAIEIMKRIHQAGGIVVNDTGPGSNGAGSV